MTESKDIVGYEGLYKIYNDGQVQNKHGKFLKPKTNEMGRTYIALNKNKERKHYDVVELVSTHFGIILTDFMNDKNKIDDLNKTYNETKTERRLQRHRDYEKTNRQRITERERKYKEANRDKYRCEKCNYNTAKRYDYNKHLKTKKHNQ